MTARKTTTKKRPPHGGRRHPVKRAAKPRPRPAPTVPWRQPAPPRNAITPGGSAVRGGIAGLLATVGVQAVAVGQVDLVTALMASAGVGLLTGFGNAVRNAREAHPKGTPVRFLLDVLGGLG